MDFGIFISKQAIKGRSISRLLARLLIKVQMSTEKLNNREALCETVHSLNNANFCIKFTSTELLLNTTVQKFLLSKTFVFVFLFYCIIYGAAFVQTPWWKIPQKHLFFQLCKDQRSNFRKYYQLL